MFHVSPSLWLLTVGVVNIHCCPNQLLLNLTLKGHHQSARLVNTTSYSFSLSFYLSLNQSKYTVFQSKYISYTLIGGLSGSPPRPPCVIQPSVSHLCQAGLCVVTAGWLSPPWCPAGCITETLFGLAQYLIIPTDTAERGTWYCTVDGLSGRVARGVSSLFLSHTPYYRSKQADVSIAFNLYSPRLMLLRYDLFFKRDWRVSSPHFEWWSACYR